MGCIPGNTHACHPRYHLNGLRLTAVVVISVFLELRADYNSCKPPPIQLTPQVTDGGVAWEASQLH